MINAEKAKEEIEKGKCQAGQREKTVGVCVAYNAKF